MHNGEEKQNFRVVSLRTLLISTKVISEIYDLQAKLELYELYEM